ncbi:junctophilin-like protein [Perilla frutescens var. frutescens]|nr:junctophilin-like protein [Perilla frutescens var. frutescens]
MATNQSPSPNNNAGPIFLPEIGPDGLARESPAIAYAEKIIEEEQLQLRKYIDENYSKIRDVEREFANLTMEMKLTAGPKKAALEHLRKKIELSTESIRVAKVKEEQAKKAWEAAAKVVQDEEAIKQKLCDDLNNLVQESSNSQLSRLEELKRRLEALNPSRSSTTNVPFEGNQRLPQGSTGQVTSAVPSTSGPSSGARGTLSTEVNAENSAITGQSQQPSSDSEGRAKKKSSNQGRVRGIGAVPKGRGPGAPGWTGAGFDVDGRG